VQAQVLAGFVCGAAIGTTPSARKVYVRLFCSAGFADSVINSDQRPPP